MRRTHRDTDVIILAQNVFRLPLGRTNSYLVRGRAGSVLVDTGLPAHGPRILAAVSRLETRVEVILLTHRHLDHAGSAELLRRRCDAPVVIHRADAPAVLGAERLSPLHGPLDGVLGGLVAGLDRHVFRFRPCAEVEPAEEGWSRLGLRLVHLPGHTPGHSGYLHEASGVVFCGDAAIHLGGRLRPPSRLFSLDRDLARRSQLKLADLDAALYCFGHGSPLERGAGALRRLGGMSDG